MKYLVILFCIFNFISCKDSHQQPSALVLSEANVAKAAIILTMEGKTYTMEQKDLVPQKLKFETDSLLYAFYTNDSPVSLNFNLFNTGILENGNVVYTIPEANSGKVKVDLNFFDKKRDASRINKRIIFRKGSIHIKQLTKNSLQMDFKGEGSGMTERSATFPISGSINVSY